MNSIRILLADDHALVRAGIRSLLQIVPGVHLLDFDPLSGAVREHLVAAGGKIATPAPVLLIG